MNSGYLTVARLIDARTTIESLIGLLQPTVDMGTSVPPALAISVLEELREVRGLLLAEEDAHASGS